MHRASILLALATIAALNVILFGGAALQGESSGRLVALAVPVLDLCNLSASAVLGFWFFQRRRRLLSVIFWLNIIAFAVVLPIRLNGIIPPRALLFGADLYWLNLYLSAFWILKVDEVRRAAHNTAGVA